MGKKRWIVQEQNPDLARVFSKELGVSPLIGQILINRGINTIEEGRVFLECDLQNIPDPFLMLGMDQAVKRIWRALDQEERIVIYGDYDADGQTATSLLVRALRSLVSDPTQIDFYLPDRLLEGYGLHAEALTKLAQEYSLLISVDCGIAAVHEATVAQKLGLDLIITDHHEPGLTLPDVVAILNPKQANCNYPNKQLAGVGVALKLVQALAVPNWEQYLDLVTLGTVADLVPLRGENRTYVKHGLRWMGKRANSGIKALLEVSDVEQPSAGDVGFRLGPRLNAAGRLGDPTRGVKLLLTEDPSEARMLALELDEENSRRQDLEERVLEEAVNLVEKYSLYKRSALVVWGEGWHQGVVGIVASRLVDLYYLPTVVVSVDGAQGTASARSIQGLDLYATLQKSEHLLVRYGGHTMAAGLSLLVENLVPFQKLFEQICAETLEPEDYIPQLRLDGFVPLKDINSDLIGELANLEPHGIGNPGPTFQTKVAVNHTRVLGQERKHLRLTVQDSTASEVSCIAFGYGQEQDAIEQGAENIELAFVPCFNDWNGKKTIQLLVQAWRLGTFSEDYVTKRMLSYPWKLPAPYYLSEALQWDGEEEEDESQPSVLDLRGTWDKVDALRKQSSAQERVLILVNTPKRALEVCRSLRISVPGGKDFIGFEHPLLDPQEQEEFASLNWTWLVSTGYDLKANAWSQIWFWDPPLNNSNLEVWKGLGRGKSEIVAIYGPKDVRSRQSYVQLACPNRETLAQVYSSLRQLGETVELKQAQEHLSKMGLIATLPTALAIFKELKLWSVEEEKIIYQPPPAQKLDLNETVLYNKVILMRKQSLDYLKRSLERGFFQDGFKRQNQSNTGFSETRY